jgi:molybdenum-dependent DNA-binding transcriptional regulator ModE
MSQTIIADLSQPNETMSRFVEAYWKHASIAEAARVMKISYATAHVWSKTDLFQRELAAIQEKVSRGMAVRAVRIVEQTLEAIEDRIRNGDEKLDRHGEKHRVKMSGKDLAVVMGIVIDKEREGQSGSPLTNIGSALRDIASALEQQMPAGQLPVAPRAEVIEGGIRQLADALQNQDAVSRETISDDDDLESQVI